MAIKNILTMCDQDRLKVIQDNLEKQFTAIYRTYGVLAQKQYKVSSELIIKELKNAQYEFFNYSDLLTKELRLSTVYDISNLISTDLVPNSTNRTIFIRGLGPAMFYQRVLNRLVGIDEDIVWSGFTTMHPMAQDTLPKLSTDYTRFLEKEEPTILEFKLAIQRSFDDSIDFFAKRIKFTNFKSW